MGQMIGPLEPTGDPGDVVIADEGQRREAGEKLVVPLQRPVQLEEVAVVEAAPDRLPQLVLGGRVEPGGIDHRRVVAVDELADEPCIRMAVPYPG